MVRKRRQPRKAYATDGVEPSVQGDLARCDIDLLSDDTFIYIFLCLGMNDMISVSQVCSFWRALSLETSSLWWDIHVEREELACVRKALTILKRCKGCLVQLTIPSHLQVMYPDMPPPMLSLFSNISSTLFKSDARVDVDSAEVVLNLLHCTLHPAYRLHHHYYHQQNNKNLHAFRDTYLAKAVISPVRSSSPGQLYIGRDCSDIWPSHNSHSSFMLDLPFPAAKILEWSSFDIDLDHIKAVSSARVLRLFRSSNALRSVEQLIGTIPLDEVHSLYSDGDRHLDLLRWPIRIVETHIPSTPYFDEERKAFIAAILSTLQEVSQGWTFMRLHSKKVFNRDKDRHSVAHVISLCSQKTSRGISREDAWLMMHEIGNEILTQLQPQELVIDKGWQMFYVAAQLISLDFVKTLRIFVDTDDSFQVAIARPSLKALETIVLEPRDGCGSRISISTLVKFLKRIKKLRSKPSLCIRNVYLYGSEEELHPYVTIAEGSVSKPSWTHVEAT